MDFLFNFIADTFGDTTHAFIVGFVGGFSLGSYSAWRIFKANTPTTFKTLECNLYLDGGYAKHDAQIGFKDTKPIIVFCENYKKKKCTLTGKKCQAFTHF